MWQKYLKERFSLTTDLLYTVLDEFTDSIYIKDIKGRYVYYNLAYGYSLCNRTRRLLQREELNKIKKDEIKYKFLGKTDLEILPIKWAKIHHKQDLDIIKTGEIFEEELRYVSIHKNPLRNSQNEIVGVVAIIRDMRMRQDIENQVSDGIIITTVDGIVKSLNEPAEKLIGKSESACHNLPLRRVLKLKDKDGKRLPYYIDKVLETKRSIEREDYCFLTNLQNKTQYIIKDVYSPIFGLDNKTVINIVIILHNLTEIKKNEAKILYEARHDSLTGLYNRMECERQLKELINEVKSDNTSVHSFLYLDLDKFKIVNDTCGHIAGDNLLRHIAHIMKNTLRKGDIIARLGGDEFGIILKYCNLNYAKRIAEKINKAITEYNFYWENHSFNISASIGITLIDKNVEDINEILKKSDIAAYKAKNEGGNKVFVFSSDDVDNQKYSYETGVFRIITRAINKKSFRYYFHPVVFK